MTVSRGIQTPVRRLLLELIAAEPEGVWTAYDLARRVYNVSDPSTSMMTVVWKNTWRLIGEGVLIEGDRLPAPTCSACAQVLHVGPGSRARTLRPA